MYESVATRSSPTPPLTLTITTEHATGLCAGFITVVRVLDLRKPIVLITRCSRENRSAMNTFIVFSTEIVANLVIIRVSTTSRALIQYYYSRSNSRDDLYLAPSSRQSELNNSFYYSTTKTFAWRSYFSLCYKNTTLNVECCGLLTNIGWLRKARGTAAKDYKSSNFLHFLYKRCFVESDDKILKM